MIKEKMTGSVFPREEDIPEEFSWKRADPDRIPGQRWTKGLEGPYAWKSVRRFIYTDFKRALCKVAGTIPYVDGKRIFEGA